jgi:hypothetical protein
MRSRLNMASSERRLGTWVKGVVASLLVAAGACTGGASTPPPSPAPTTASAVPTATESSSPSPSDATRYPNLSRFTDPFDRFAYKSAFSDCRFIGVDGTAEAFGGDPSQPSSVARAYAAATFPGSEEHREASFQGCLDAFESEEA